MANQAGPVCRLCRREGAKLYLKGAKCVTNCTFDKRSGLLPGQHGLARRRKASDYGIQLRAKQKAKRIYGVLETQFRHYFERSEGAEGVTGTVLLQQLERRLDNVVYRLGLASSRREARQLVSHRHFKVNGRALNIASAQLRPGDVVEVRERMRVRGDEVGRATRQNLVRDRGRRPVRALAKDPAAQALRILRSDHVFRRGR